MMIPVEMVLNRVRWQARWGLRLAILGGLLSGMVQGQGLAQGNLAFSLSTFTPADSNSPYYIGFEFNLAVSRTVSQLGVLNTNNNTTLPGNTGVGIYSVSPGGSVSKPATAVVTAIVPAGTTSTYIGAGGAFFVNVTPTVLAPGNYVLLTETGSPHESYGSASAYFQPGITYVNGWYGGTAFPGVGNNLTLTNQSNQGNNWFSGIFALAPPPTGTTLDFSTASSGSIPDSNGQGTGFTIRLQETGANYTGNDQNLTLSTSARSLTMRSTASDVNGSLLLGSAEYIGVPLLQYGISTGSDFVVRATFANIQFSQNYDQLGVFVGADALHIVRGGVRMDDSGNLFTALTIDDGTGFDTGLVTGPVVAVGDTLVMTLSRVAGQWAFYVENKTNPANSGAVTITPPSIPDSSLIAGVFAGNPGNTTPKVQTVKSFYAGQLPASTVSFAGSDLTTHGAWRTPGVTKALDGDANNIYGSDGYVVTKSGPVVSNPAYATVTQLTTYSNAGNGNFASIDNPQSAGLIGTGLWYSTSAQGSQDDMARITFSRIVKTRVGILVSHADFVDSTPDNLRIRQTVGSTGSAGDSGLIACPLNPARTGDWYFFDITAKPGDVFVISGTNAYSDSQQQTINGIGAITFDQVTVIPVSITTSNLGNATQGSSYSLQLNAINGTAPYTWSATGLPAGLSVSTGGQISGSPSVSGNFTVTVRVVDSASGTGTTTFSLTVVPSLVPLYITGSGNLGTTSVGKPAGSGSFSASGGVGPYSWNLAGAPSGISLSSSGSGATVSGTPQQAGVFSFSVTVSDAQGLRASANGSVSVLGLTGANLPDGTAFANYAGSFPAVGGAPPYSFQVTGLPPGLGVTSDGLVRGIPQRAGTYVLGVTVSESGGNTASGNATLVINPAPVLTLTGTMPGGSVNSPYSASLGATGGGAPYIFSIAGGALPDGVRMSSSGSFSGTPTNAGTFTFTARVTDISGTSVTGNFSIVIAPPPMTILAPSPLPAGMVTVDYPAQTLGAQGGIGPYTYKVTDGSLPGGITVSLGGAVGGTPTATGNFSFTVTATDTTGLTASAGLTLGVRPLTGDIILSDGALAFSLAAGTTSLPSGATVRVQSTDVTKNLSWTATSGVPWLDITGANGNTPGSFSVALNSGAAALAGSTTPYPGTVTVTCATAPCAGRSQAVAITALVQGLPPQLSVSAGSLAFTGSTTAPGAQSQSIAISNSGGGTMGIGSISCGAPWCHVSGVPATLAAGASAAITVTVDSLAAGYYYSQLDIATSGGRASVPVTYFVAGSPEVTLAPAGLTTSIPAGGAYSGPSPSFLVTVQNGGPVNWTASIAQGDFLRLGSASGTASTGQPGRIDYSLDAASVAALNAGTYYGTIRVSATGVANSPQDYTVVLTVTPATERPKPSVSPAGLVFFSSLGGTPAAQTVKVYTSSKVPVPFQWSAWTEDGIPWIAVTPATRTTSAAQPEETSVAINTAKLTPGVYRGLVNYAFEAMGVRSVNVTLIVQPPVATSLLKPEVAGCVAKQIVPTQTGLVTNFSAPASWPVPLEITLTNDCGDPVTSGQLVTTFSNGDPPLPLVALDPTSGRYAGTWTPRKTTGQITVTALANAPGYPAATAKFGGVVTPNNAPVLNKDAVLNIYNPVGGVPAAPGTLVSIKGQYLASQPVTNTKVPLPTILGGTSVFIGGLKAPIASVTPSQVNVQVPAELATGQPYQVVISANGALTTPDGLQMADASPGLSLLPTGFVNATHQAGGVVTEASPAKPGESIVIYLAGMGLTQTVVASGAASPADPARVANPPSITLDGLAVSYDFAGLTPGLVGVYQINMTVPAAAKNGNLTLTLQQAGAASNSGLLPVQK